MKQQRKRRSALLGFLLYSENSLSKPKATILVPDSPKSSEAMEGSGYGSTPSCPGIGAAGAQDGLPEPSIPRCHGPALNRVTAGDFEVQGAEPRHRVMPRDDRRAEGEGGRKG